MLRFEEDGRYTVVKVYRRMPLVAERWGAFAEYSDPEWSVPRIDDIDIERGTLTMEDCAGRTLHRRWLEGDGRSEDGDRVARLLR
ncbi:MAG: hypothetical protein OER88_14045, partial [Planctomycetota bacterium]|nr:hypothetical protein [Planctomycetota bacterium]